MNINNENSKQTTTERTKSTTTEPKPNKVETTTATVTQPIPPPPTTTTSRTDNKKDYENNYRYKGQPYINPFVHKLEFNDSIDIIKAYIFTVLIIPIRVIFIFIFLLISWVLASIGLYGLTPEELKTKPITGWRRMIQKITALSMRGLFVAGGFNYINYKGVQASPKEAPILCVAPHSSYADSIVVVILGPPSIVAKSETSQLPFFGKLINYSQPIYVMREDPNSRHNTIKEIVERANANEEWPQIVIFPEGTCTNRSALITFKPGAFYPGVPVQPVIIRYPNRIDSYTWTWEGPGILKLIWITLTQLHNSFEIEFLPVYNPSEEEKSNPKLFAKNVRDVMAKALGVPTSDFTYDDCKIMTKAKDMHIPYTIDIVEINKLGKLLDVKASKLHEQYTAIKQKNNEQTDYVDYSELSKVFNVSDDDDIIYRQIFSILDSDKIGKINLRDYLITVIFLSRHNDPIIEFLRDITKLYTSQTEIFTKDTFYAVMKHSGQISKEESDMIFNQLNEKCKGNVRFDDFIKFIKNKPDYEWLFKTDGKPKIQ